MTKKDLSIYVHIPFCESKCIYCAFNSFVANEEIIKEYFNNLKREIINNSILCKDKFVRTIYFGGGTPSSVNSKYIIDILNTIKENFHVYKNAEINIECNPNSATKEKLKNYFDAGFNRVSFGVQSLDNSELSFLNRKHNNEIALNAIKLSKNIGFKHINADLIIGLKSQSREKFEKTINDLINAGVDHFSCYMLMVERNTKLIKMKNNKTFLMEDDNCVDMYNSIYKILKNNHYIRYEISNFSKENCECKHNLVYWNMGEYLGFGLSSHSLFNGYRIENTQNIQKYNNGIFIKKRHKISKCEKIEEYVMLSLRTRKGLNLQKYHELSGKNILDEKKEEIQELQKYNLISINNKFLRITAKNFGKSNSIILKLI